MKIAVWCLFYKLILTMAWYVTLWH